VCSSRIISEQRIAIKYAFEQEKIVIEGAASVGIEASMNNLVKDIGREIVTIISSRNINVDILHQILCHNGH
jgi:threonine dehydratase